MAREGNALDWSLRVTMPDGSRWDVPVRLIAESRARHYARRDDVPFNTALKEAVEMFTAYPDEIEDWAENNMDWSEVAAAATLVTPASAVDSPEGWVNGPKEIVC